jgi:hypothetical protein
VAQYLLLGLIKGCFQHDAAGILDFGINDKFMKELAANKRRYYGFPQMTAQRAQARALTKVLWGKSPLPWGQCPSTTLRVLRR